MDTKEIIEKLGLNNDFFERNPAVIGRYDRELIIGFSNWRLKFTRDEYDRLRNYLHWGCGACCGFGTYYTEEEGEYIVIEGIPCTCHTSWSWVAQIPL